MTYQEEQAEEFEELKRADHLLFVSLKYTKTIDVIKNIIRRLINAYDYAIIRALTKLKEKNKIKDIPLSPISRAEVLRDLTKKKIEMLDFLELYFSLKNIDRAEYTKKEEYRKNVTLTVMQDDEVIAINIPKLHEFYKKTKEFVNYVKENF